MNKWAIANSVNHMHLRQNLDEIKQGKIWFAIICLLWFGLGVIVGHSFAVDGWVP